jgi:hypothetical protein
MTNDRKRQNAWIGLYRAPLRSLQRPIDVRSSAVTLIFS